MFARCPGEATQASTIACGVDSERCPRRGSRRSRSRRSSRDVAGRVDRARPASRRSGRRERSSRRRPFPSRGLRRRLRAAALCCSGSSAVSRRARLIRHSTEARTRARFSRFGRQLRCSGRASRAPRRSLRARLAERRDAGRPHPRDRLHPELEVGYVIGENLAWGTLSLATPAGDRRRLGRLARAPREHPRSASTRETGIGVTPPCPRRSAKARRARPTRRSSA